MAGTRRRTLAVLGATVLTLAAMSMVMHGRPASATFPGTNGRIAFKSNRTGAGDIYIMNADGSNQTQLTTDPNEDSDPAFSSNGTRIAFSSARSGGGDIYVMNADGSNQTRITTSSDGDVTPSWSPDGTKIVFARAPAATNGNLQTYDIFVMNADGTNEQRLTTVGTPNGGGLVPKWSPNGTKIAFVANRTNPLDASNYDIFVMNADGTNQTNLTASSTAVESFPSWSPDGTRLAFMSSRDGNNEIYVMNADGSNPTRLTTAGAIDAEPAWSPDGTKIVFESTRGGNADIWVMNANGTGLTQLTTDPAIDVRADWGVSTTVPPSSSTTTTSTTTTIYSTTATPLPVASVAPVSQPLVTTTLAIMNSPYVAAGSSFAIGGTGFMPSQQLQAFLFSTPMFLGTVVSDVNGNYQGLFNIPLIAPAGPHTVVVQGAGRSGSPNESVATIVVTAPGTQPAAASYGYGVAGSSGVIAAPTTSTTSPTFVSSSTPAAAGSGRVAFTGSNLRRPLLAGSLLLVIGLYLVIAGYLRHGLIGRRAS
jgi:Tol biopolymer transport system component